MKVFTAKSGDVVTIRALAEGAGPIGDLVLDLRPGDVFLGHSHAFWAALPDGAHDVEPKDDRAK